ncbi:MAG TPA: PQQ-dependent dehydrogenase, methanol/ethanol family [Steroidobacteraceae bacterium]|nr:PQQ-dependent dehydrogenase, methanol/ethanol family [Steroidobacteraceae bacterium]
MIRRIGLAAVIVLAPLLAVAAPAGVAQVDDTRLAHAEREPQNWLTHGGDWNERRFSRLAQINVQTVRRLKPAWYFDYDTTRGQEATPLVVDGVMYVSTAWSKVYALDARTGRQIWFFDPKVPGSAAVPTCCDIVNRGVAVYKGLVYVGTVDGRLIALNAATGTPVWSTVTTPVGTTYSITGAPRVARDKVFIGNAGSEFGGRGYVSAYDARSGKLIWRFYTVPGDPAAKQDGAASDEVLARLARPTWFGDWYKYGGGGHVWNALVFDPDLNQVYFGTGNGYPWSRVHRSAGKGDNLFIASIVAVDADTGRYKWHYQEVPGEEWDYDAIADITLVDLRIDGQLKKVLLHAPKDGFFYVIERATGKVLSAQPYISGLNWATRVDLATGRPEIVAAARYQDAPWLGIPGGGGGHNWQPVAFSPMTGLIYIPATESSTYYELLPEFRYVQGIPHIGINRESMVHGGPASGPPKGPTGAANSAYLLAWNPVTQSEAWRANGRGNGVLATAGNLVFQGRSRAGLLGELVAFRADTGERVWSYNTPNAIVAGPVMYSVGGEQYVAVSSGPSAVVFTPPARMRDNGRMLAFKLDGTATLPPDSPLAPPANPPDQIASSTAYNTGKAHYDLYCARCHGFDAQSANVIPDLRRSPMLTDKSAWKRVVIDGALTDRGMVSWAKFLSPADAETIRAYVGEQARALQQQELSSSSTR